MQTTLAYHTLPNPPSPIHQCQQSIGTDLEHIAMNWNLTPSTSSDTTSPTAQNPIPSALSPNADPLTWSPMLISALRRLSELTIGKKERAYALLETYSVRRKREAGKRDQRNLEVEDVGEVMKSLEVINKGRAFEGVVMGGTGKRKREWDGGDKDVMRTPVNRKRVVGDMKTPSMFAESSVCFGRVAAARGYSTPVSMASASRCSTPCSIAPLESMPYYFTVTPQSLSQRRSMNTPRIQRIATQSFTPLSLKTTELASLAPLYHATTLSKPPPHTPTQPTKFPPKPPISALLNLDTEGPFKPKHQQFPSQKSTTDAEHQSFEFHLPPLSALFPPTPTPANFHAGNSSALWAENPVLQKVPDSFAAASMSSGAGPLSSCSTTFSPSLFNMFTEWPETPVDACASKAVGDESDVKEEAKGEMKGGDGESSGEDNKREGEGDGKKEAEREAEMVRLLSCA